MRACDQSFIFSIGGKFRPDYGLLSELHTLTLVARSYALLIKVITKILGSSFKKLGIQWHLDTS